MSFYRDTIRTARKEHKCGLCRGIIKKGDKYHDKACNSASDDNNIYYGKECEPCQPVITEFMESLHADEGYCDEEIHEWWLDTKCPDCKFYYLSCKPDENCQKEFIKDGSSCLLKTKYDTCKAEDTCNDMTHYCRCEKYGKVGE